MYRHLLVPLDDSPLAVENVNQAVKLAKTLGAKVTFFHAQADYGASGVGALERVMSPAVFNEHMAGEARAILAKAEVVARIAGVPHDSAVMTSDRPHEAILHVADTRGCDLIFIASHGRRGIKGLMLGSETQKVLQNTTIPVLVSAVESNLPDSDILAPLTILRDEMARASLKTTPSGRQIATIQRGHDDLVMALAQCWACAARLPSPRNPRPALNRSHPPSPSGWT